MARPERGVNCNPWTCVPWAQAADSQRSGGHLGLHRQTEAIDGTMKSLAMFALIDLIAGNAYNWSHGLNSRSIESLIEVGQYVLDMLDADRQANISVGHP
jgi:hypothetical protein